MSLDVFAAKFVCLIVCVRCCPLWGLRDEPKGRITGEKNAIEKKKKKLKSYFVTEEVFLNIARAS